MKSWFKNNLRGLGIVFSMLIILIGIVVIILFLKSLSDQFDVGYNGRLNMSATGQAGDFVGGIVGTFFALSGTILLYLTLREQGVQNKHQKFETTFFELVRLHRENVSELNYTKYDGVNYHTSLHRKVFRVIWREFTECYKDVRKYLKSDDVDEYVLPVYKKKLLEIQNSIGREMDLIEFISIDIAFCVVYYGISNEEGFVILKHNFRRKYDDVFLHKLLRYLQLKPKVEHASMFKKWIKLRSLNKAKMLRITNELYNHRTHVRSNILSEDAKVFVPEKEYEKYYGGHQHRLGHYFRHLFQSYKYLNIQEILSKDEKYFYGKTLRAQLSTYEQALLFVNSISSIGLQWELDQEIKNKDELDEKTIQEIVNNNKLITKYNLIKNLPGNHYLGLTFKDYYPKVEYESDNILL